MSNRFGLPFWKRPFKTLTGARSNKNKPGRLQEGARLINDHSSTSNYGAVGQPDTESLPPYTGPAPALPSGGYQPNNVHRSVRDPSPSRRRATITIGCICLSIILLVVLAQAGVFVFFYDLPSKLDDYNRATARMREQRGAMREEARHLDGKRIALRGESNRLERERLALESSTREMEGEKDALESAIRRSEQERSRLEREKQLLESERQLLEQEEESLREERERWEKAREDRVPQGAFWDPFWPAWDCRAYGKREYWGELKNIPQDWTAMDACTNMPVEIKGVTVRRPYRCGYVEGSPHIHGFWMVDWDQPDCKPRLQDLTDTVCSGTQLVNSPVSTPLMKFDRRAARTRDPVVVVSKLGSWISTISQDKTGVYCARARL